MALKKTPPRKKRLQLAKIWIPKYDGKNLAKGYRKYFALSPLAAVKDLQLLGYEFTDEYINELKLDEIQKGNKKKLKKAKCIEKEYMDESDNEMIDYYGFIDEDIDIVELIPKKRKFKNHELIDGKLLQTNKKYSHLKQKQKELIANWFRIEYVEFYERCNKFPSSKNEKEAIVDSVYSKIEKCGIWIPYSEIKGYFIKKQTKLKNSVLKKLGN